MLPCAGQVTVRTVPGDPQDTPVEACPLMRALIPDREHSLTGTNE